MGHIHEAEARRRIESMSCEDILELSSGAIDRLLCVSYGDYVGLYPEKIVRLMVSRGKDKREKKRIFSRVKDTYKSFWPYNFASFDSDDYDCDAAWYFSGIEFDISTNFPLLSDEEENADDNSPLPNPNSSPSGEDGRRLSELNSRIAELEEENEALKQQIEELQSQPPTSEVQQASTNEALVELFSNVMYGDEQNAKAFIESAKGRNDVEITDLVAQYVRENKISIQSCRRDLWRLLHAYKLYNGTESNYNTAMRNKQ